MKKIILLLLVCGFMFTSYAQEVTDSTVSGKTKMKTDDGKTKIKDDKAKSKDNEGKMKIKDKDDMSGHNESKTKIKDDKAKVKDGEEKVKVKGNGNMNTDMNSNTSTSGTMTNGMTTNSSSNVDVVVIGGWRTDPANLPVVGNNIAPEVVTTLKSKYGNTIYDIKKIRSTAGQDIYGMRVMENGGTRTMYVGADGNVVSQ
jgi:hypothetical protein